MTDDTAELSAEGRSPAARIGLVLALAIAFVGFLALGTWQLERRAWKLDLIARVDQRVHATPAEPPGPARWATVNANDDEYRHVRLVGNFLPGRDTFVQAVTELGAGFWLITPLRLADGSIVLVNRGYVSSQAPAGRSTPPGGQVTVTGLLRMTEPGGGFLRRNDAAADRWYSRDVQAIAAARALSPAAPYFVDAEAPSAANGPASGLHEGVEPVPGLTVITFHNSHLVYAITWYALALGVALGGWRGLRVNKGRSGR